MTRAVSYFQFLGSLPHFPISHCATLPIELSMVESTSEPPTMAELNNGVKAKKPLSFYMTFLALSICVLLVSLDATALSVAVPVSSKPHGKSLYSYD